MTTGPLDALLDIKDDAQLQAILAGLSDDERQALIALIDDYDPIRTYRGDPLAVIHHVFNEATWHKQDEIARAVEEHRRVVVAATHSVSKSHTTSRIAAATIVTWPPDLVRTILVAPTGRKVREVLLAYLRRLHLAKGLPGEVNDIGWKIGKERVAPALALDRSDETALSGYHVNGRLLIIVDEGGGITDTVGRSINDVLTGNASALVIGNFPTDTETTWFNRIWKSPEWHQISISAYDSPNFPRPYGKSLRHLKDVEKWERIAREQPDHPAVKAGLYEEVGPCTVCPSGGLAPHTIAEHLVGPDWVREVVAEFGEDSAYYTARVLAIPPTGLSDKTLPMLWLEAILTDEPAKPGRIKLGIDPAVDGGDELSISRMIGRRVEHVHASSGADNADSVRVAGKCLQAIREAEALHKKWGIDGPVRVKIDAAGVGRGVSDLLLAWGREGQHGAKVIPVQSAARAHDPERFENQRSEMWWTFREAINPETAEEDRLELAVDMRVLSQLSEPGYSETTRGKIVVERKPEVKKRIKRSPDRADSTLLAVYEPPVFEAPVAAGFTIRKS